jgi:hypothetical protein
VNGLSLKNKRNFLSPELFSLVRKNQEGFISELSKKLRVSQKPSWFKIKKPPLSMVFKTVFRGC